MSDNVLHRYMSAKPIREESVSIAEDESEDNLGAFGWLRGVRDRAIMLELRRKDGSSMSLDYGWLRKVEFNPSEGITLYFDGEVIRIVGRNLNKEARPNVRLLRGILAHRVPWIQEAGGSARLTAGDSVPVIEELRW